MKLFFKTGAVLVIVIILFSVACKKEISRKEEVSEITIQNLGTFARLYGYARWFHPSDEAQEIDWGKFAVLGVRKVQNIRSATELRDTLYRLFSPIVQGLQIYEADKPETFNPDILLSPDPGAKSVVWQHLGVYLSDQSIYKSIRINTSDLDKITNSTTIFKQISNPSQLNGKEVKFSGYFRGQKGEVKLAILPFINSITKNLHEIPIEVTQDWEKYEIRLKIPLETTSIIYGFELDGATEVWVDNFEFVVNNEGAWESIDSANMGFECGKTEKEDDSVQNWLTFVRLHTIEVSDTNPYSGKYCLKVSIPEKMFGYIPQFGEITKASIGNNLIGVIPLTLLMNESSTYPETDTKTLNQLQSELANINLSRYSSNPDQNLASIIIAWNVIQHFFPISMSLIPIGRTYWKKHCKVHLKTKNIFI